MSNQLKELIAGVAGFSTFEALCERCDNAVEAGKLIDSLEASAKQTEFDHSQEIVGYILDLASAAEENDIQKIKIESLESQLKQHEWIKCEDELPEEGYDIETYLVCIEDFGQRMALFIGGEWWKDYTAKIVKPVTRWKPINPPTE